MVPLKPERSSNRKSAIKNRQLTILSCFCQIVVDHTATIFPGFGDSSVSAFFVAADLVFRVETFEHELARRNELRGIARAKIKRDCRSLPQFRHRIQERLAFLGRRSVSQQ